jgi:enoyl-CoA hydratase
MAAAPTIARKTEEDGVEIVVLKNPPLNLLSRNVLRELGVALDSIERSPGTRCVVLTGDGTYFSAGADLKEIAAIGIDHASEVARAGQALFGRLESMRAPTIAALNGLAVGGGLELALACDLRVAGESAKLGAPEVNYGLMPAYGGTQRLPRLIGNARAKEMIFTGNLVPAAEAMKIGLVNRVVPAGQELRAARDLAHTIAQRAPRAVAGAKRAIVDGSQLSLKDGLEMELREFEKEVLPSVDLVEGIAAFVERRPPKFKGE